MRVFIFFDQMMFKIKVSTTKTSAKIGVSLASLASQVLAFPLDRKLSAPPEIAPDRPALLPLCIRTITVTARPERSWKMARMI